MFNSNFGRCPILISRPFAKLEWVLLTSKLQTSPVLSSRAKSRDLVFAYTFKARTGIVRRVVGILGSEG